MMWEYCLNIVCDNSRLRAGGKNETGLRGVDAGEICGAGGGEE
jgi:hypothetical protein